MRVQAKAMLGTLALLLGSGVLAQSSGQDELRAIAKASGLHVREVQMLLSNSPSAHSGYVTYSVSARKLRRAIQEGRLQLLPSQVRDYPEFAARRDLPAQTLTPAAVTVVAQESDSPDH